MKNSIIKPIPVVPKAIIEAINNKRLAIFIGAGVSRLIGCSSWSDLGRNLILKCHESGTISYKEKESLEKNYEPKKVISICHGILQQKEQENDFYDVMGSSLKDGEQIETPNIYSLIKKIPGLYITTNADRHFHGEFIQENILYKKPSFQVSNVADGKLFQIHGCISDKESLVFTHKQYFQRYTDEFFNQFLEKIFNEYTILFLGYGLGEFELLEYLHLKSGSSKNNIIRHYLLQPFYIGEDNLLEFERSYYREMGIQVEAYAKDSCGYKQLEKVLEQWHRDIYKMSGHLCNSFQEIDTLIDEHTSQNENRIMQLILNDEPLEQYTYKKLSEIDHPQPWLAPFEKNGYLNPEKNPSPKAVEGQEGYYTVPFWRILPFLENVAQKNLESSEESITDLLAEVIDAIINYKDSQGKRMDNYHTDYLTIKIFLNLPPEKIKEQHIDFIKQALSPNIGTGSLIQNEIVESCIPYLIKHKLKELTLKLLDICFSFKVNSNGYEKIKPLIQDRFILKIITDFTNDIAELCGLEMLDIMVKRISELSESSEYFFSTTWLETIEKSENNPFGDKYRNLIITFTKKIVSLVPAESIKELIESMLKNKNLVLRRLSLYAINQNYDQLKDIFWECDDNLFGMDFYEMKHELLVLLTDNAKKFNADELAKLIDLIENAEYGNFDNDGKIKYEALCKKEWFHAILSSENPRLKELYEKYNRINPTVIDTKTHFRSEFGFVQHLSPIEEAELNSKNIKEIVTYLNDYPETNEWGLKRISKTGLKDCFKACVKQSPQKYIRELDELKLLKIEFQQTFLRAIQETKETIEVNEWKKVIAFIFNIIKPEAFWSQEYKDGYNFREWTIVTICEIIENGANHERNIFDKDLLDNIENLLIILLNKTNGSQKVKGDVVTHFFNSAKGKILSAMVNYSYCIAKSKKEKSVKWTEGIKAEFTSRLDRENDNSVEYSVCLGKYLDSFMYLDKEWTISNIDKIICESNIEHFKIVIYSYFFSLYHINEEIYDLLKSKGIFKKSLEQEFRDEKSLEKLIQLICIGYLSNKESFNDEKSLISCVLNSKKPEHYSEVIYFWWTLRESNSENSDYQEKTKELWGKLYEVLNIEQDKPEFRHSASQLSMWLDIVDQIDDDVKNYMELSVKYSEFGGADLVDHLYRHTEKCFKKVGEILLSMLEAEKIPSYHEDNIKVIVGKLYSEGLSECANKICNIYFEHNMLFLRDIYQKNQS